MKWLGLTGGIATGKSTVKKLIEGQGIPVVDADEISHLVCQPGEAGYQKILQVFGPDYFKPDKSLDRQKLGELVFKSIAEKNKLEAILHPLIKDRVQQRRQYLEKAGHVFCFYDVPLLFEKNLQKDFDRIVLVWCEEAIQMQRLMKRNRLTLVDAQNRIQNQSPMSIKVFGSQHCIDNSTNLKSLSLQVDQLLQRLKSDFHC